MDMKVAKEARPQGALCADDPRPGLGHQLPADGQGVPARQYEGIKIHDWDKWEDPFRLTMDAYWKYQAEKERKLYAMIDAFAQNNGHLGVTDARYINALKLFLPASAPLEYMAAPRLRPCRPPVPRRRSARRLPDAVARRDPSLADADPLDVELQQVLQRHARFAPHAIDRMWYLSVPSPSSTMRSPPGRSSSWSPSASPSNTC